MSEASSAGVVASLGLGVDVPVVVVGAEVVELVSGRRAGARWSQE